MDGIGGAAERIGKPAEFGQDALARRDLAFRRCGEGGDLGPDECDEITVRRSRVSLRIRSSRHRAIMPSSLARMLGTITNMSVQLNHTIVSCRDQQRSAAFLSEILGLPTPRRFSHFLVVEADNGVSLDFSETTGAITSQHYAFLVGEDDFDAAFGRLRDQDLPYWADPGKSQPSSVNHRDGGRGVYFEDPDGHLLEILTRPYGSGS
ncbi:MAG TPA: VOC family protein [Streptosporangiaceae bacterium]|nr:VOC family protein [Streptosporangiaceae bacterium]